MLSLNDIKNLSLETTRGGYRKEGVEEFVSCLLYTARCV